MNEFMNFKFTSEWWALIAPLILCILDVLTGYIHAWINNDVKSYKMREGLGKKFGELIYVVLGIIAKYALGTSSIMLFMSAYICFMEIVSLFENCAKLGVPMPEKIKEKINHESEGK